MREYSKVSAQFWTGATGRSLRGDLEAQLLALYLVTCPHSNMEGVFYCPVMFMAHETGLSTEGASKALQRLSRGGFCTYDHPSEVVFVHEMAAHQIGDTLNPKDNMVKAVQASFDKMQDGIIKRCFFKRYAKAYHLKAAPNDAANDDENGTPFEPPSNPLRSTETKTETKTETEEEPPTPLPGDDADRPLEPKPEPVTPSKPPAFDPLTLPLPDCVPLAAWAEWIAYRRERRLTCREATLTKQAAFLAEANQRGNSPRQLIDLAIRNGWQGLFEPKATVTPFTPPTAHRQARRVYQ